MKMTFTDFFYTSMFLCCWFTTLANDSRHAWSFLELILLKVLFRLSRRVLADIYISIRFCGIFVHYFKKWFLI